MDEHLWAASVAQEAAVREKLTAQRAYKSCYNAFEKWVNTQRDLNRIGITDKYLVRKTVDLFFLEYIPTLRIAPRSVCRYKYALQWHADNREHIHTRFIVDSPIVAQSLKLYAEDFKKLNRSETGRERDNFVAPDQDLNAPLSDPYSNLPTNVVDWEETKKAIFYILRTRLVDWFALLVIWTWSIAASLRNISIRSICLSDIVLDTSHGAERSGPLSRSINLVLRPSTGKESFTSNRVVGSWRGKDWWHCPVGQLAFSLLFRLNNFASDMSFYNKDQKKDCFWRNTLFIAKDTYDDCYKAIKQVMTACGISSNKVTHFGRVWGIDFASFLGMSEPQMRRQTKHEDGSLSRSYASELDYGMMKTMANFLPEEKYYCPRAIIGTPLPVSDLSHLLFPNLAIWRAQQGHRYGDSHSRDFLYGLLPYLAEVCAQDGIYLIEAFPSHPVSQILICKIPNYVMWAREKRQQVATMITNYDQESMKNLNEAVQSSHNVMVRRQEELQRVCVQHFAQSTIRQNELRDMYLQQGRQLQRVMRHQEVISEQLGVLVANRNQGNNLHHFTAPTAVAGRASTTTERLPPTPTERLRDRMRPLLHANQETPTGPVQPNALNRLASHGEHPLCSILKTPFPKTIRNVLSSFVFNRMIDFSDPKARRGLTTAGNLAYSKRKYLYDAILKHASCLRRESPTESHQVRWYKAADKMDATMKEKKLSVDQFRKWLKSVDPESKKRKRTNQAVPHAGV